MKKIVVLFVILCALLVTADSFAGEKSAVRIYANVARDLTWLECPEILPADAEIFRKDFQLVWQSEFYTSELWLAALREKVADLSEGKVSVARADPASFAIQIKGPGLYLYVRHRDGREMGLFVGPYDNPFTCFFK